MNFTSRSRYALKIMMDLAHHSDLPHVHRKDIAARQGVPTDYLDQIMIWLRRAKLVESVRGRGGGYRLSRPAEEINLWQLFSAVEQAIEPVRCLVKADSCGFDSGCSSHDAWQFIFAQMRHPLENICLSEVSKKFIEPHHLCPAGGVRECKAPAQRTVNSQSDVAVLAKH